MNKKLAYIIIPVLGLAVTGAVSAQGMRGGLGYGLTADEIANRHQIMFQNQAQMLGLNIDEVKNAWAEGKTIKDLMSEKGINKEQVQARVKESRISQMKTQLKALVEKGIVTQTQADNHLKIMEERIKNNSGWFGMKLHRGFMR